MLRCEYICLGIKQPPTMGLHRPNHPIAARGQRMRPQWPGGRWWAPSQPTPSGCSSPALRVRSRSAADAWLPAQLLACPACMLRHWLNLIDVHVLRTTHVAVIPLYFYLRPSKIYSTGAASVWIAKFCGVTAAGCSVFLLVPVTKTLTDGLRCASTAARLFWKAFGMPPTAAPGCSWRPTLSLAAICCRRIPGMTRLFNFDANISSRSMLAVALCLPVHTAVGTAITMRRAHCRSEGTSS